MASADANYSFIWVDIRKYGKCSNSGVFKNSTLYDRLKKNMLNIPEPKPATLEDGTTPLPYNPLCCCYSDIRCSFWKAGKSDEATSNGHYRTLKKFLITVYLLPVNILNVH